jgi:hypothetical protein
MPAVASWYHCSVKPVSRSAGRSAVAAPAYRVGECLYDEMLHQTYDYTRRSGIVTTFALVPDGSPDWVHEPEAPVECGGVRRETLQQPGRPRL